jgi:hypothetical protein
MKQTLPVRSPEESAFDARVAAKAPIIFKLTNNLEGSMRLAAHMAAADMRSEGADQDTVERLLREYLRRFVDQIDDVPVSQELQQELVRTFVAEGGREPRQMLLEHLVKTPTGYRMFIWPNESKHPGTPHLTVVLDDEKINVSISSKPEVLAGRDDLPGTGKILRTIAKHRKPLLKEWHDLRPDDQKVKNFKAKKLPKKRQ